MSIVSYGRCFGQGYGEWQKGATILRPSPRRDETDPRMLPTVSFNQAKHGNLSSPTVVGTSNPSSSLWLCRPENIDLSKNPLRIILRIFLLQLFPEVAPGGWGQSGNLDTAMKTICKHKIIVLNFMFFIFSFTDC